MSIVSQDNRGCPGAVGVSDICSRLFQVISGRVRFLTYNFLQRWDRETLMVSSCLHYQDASFDIDLLQSSFDLNPRRQGRWCPPWLFLKCLAEELGRSRWDLAEPMRHPVHILCKKRPGEVRLRSYKIISRTTSNRFSPKSWFQRLNLFPLAGMETLRMI